MNNTTEIAVLTIIAVLFAGAVYTVAHVVLHII